MIERMFAPSQASLFGDGDIAIDRTFGRAQRAVLSRDAWLDYMPGWLTGDERLFSVLADAAAWTSPEVKMYDRVVRTPRLTATIDGDWHPILGEMRDALSSRYGVPLDRISAGLYRDGRDSVAWHGDRIARELPDAIVATVSLAGPRRFVIRPKGGGESISYSLGHGDLVVMGGSCQRTWEHAVPKVKTAPPRIALMFRHAYPGLDRRASTQRQGAGPETLSS